MTMQQKLLAVMGVTLVLAVPRLGHAQYDFTTIDVPGAVRTTVNGSSTRAVVGEFDIYDGFPQTHGYILHNGHFTTIDPPDSVYTTVYGINESGAICGYFERDDYVTHGFVRTPKGAYITIDPPGSVHTFCNGINAFGAVVGVYRDANFTRHGFVWFNGHYVTFNVPGAGGRNGGTIPLGLNDLGVIVGDYTTSSDGTTLDRHGFVLIGGRYTTLDAPGSVLTVATAIDDEGVIVGTYEDEVISDYGALYFQHGYVLINGKYVTIDVDGPESQTAIETINAEGQIAGFFTDINGDTHGFVGTPVAHHNQHNR